jgi:hypothetical protein
VVPVKPVTPWFAHFDLRLLLLFLSLAFLASFYGSALGKYGRAGLLLLLIGVYYFVLYWATHQP